MKISTLITSKPGLEELLNISFPINLSLKLSKFVTSINEVLQMFDNKKLAILKKYGTDMGEGRWEFPTAEITSDVNDMIQKLIDEEVEIEVPTITIQDLIDNNTKIKPTTISSLDWLIK